MAAACICVLGTAISPVGQKAYAGVSVSIDGAQASFAFGGSMEEADEHTMAVDGEMDKTFRLPDGTDDIGNVAEINMSFIEGKGRMEVNPVDNGYIREDAKTLT